MLGYLAAALIHASVAGGVGVAYGMVGAHVEMRYGPAAIFAGLGFVDFPHPIIFNAVNTTAPVVGLRLYSGDGDGLFASVYGGYFYTRLATPHTGEFSAAERYVVAMTVGWRLRLGASSPASVEFSAGPAMSIVHEWGDQTGTITGAGPYDRRKTHFGAVEKPGIPDLSAAFAYDF